MESTFAGCMELRRRWDTTWLWVAGSPMTCQGVSGVRGRNWMIAGIGRTWKRSMIVQWWFEIGLRTCLRTWIECYRG